MLVKALLMSGDHAAAVAACDGLNALAGDHTDLLLTCGIALQQRDDPRAAQVLSRLQSIAPAREPALAQWYAATGDLARAFEVLTRLRAIGNLPPNLAFDPLFDALRADARYAALIAAR
jgi:hypothetical protein